MDAAQGSCGSVGGRDGRGEEGWWTDGVGEVEDAVVGGRHEEVGRGEGE